MEGGDFLMAGSALEQAGALAMGVLAMAIVSGISFSIGEMGKELSRTSIASVEAMSDAGVESTVITLNSTNKSIPAAHLYMIISKSDNMLDNIRSVSEDQFLNNPSYELRDYDMTVKSGEPTFNINTNPKSPIKDLDNADLGAYPLFQTFLPPPNPPYPLGDGAQRPQETYVVRRVTISNVGNLYKYVYNSDTYGNPVFEAETDRLRSSVRIRHKDDLIPIFHKQLRVRVIQMETSGDQTGDGIDDLGDYVVLVTEG